MKRLRNISMLGLLAVSLALFSLSPAIAAETPSAWDEKYKDEPYVNLLDEVSVTVDKECSATTYVHKVKRIQNEDARKLGEIPIYYDKSCEEVKDIEACTISPDGKTLKCEKVQDLSSSGESSVYSDERVKMVTMPGVVVGSLIDLKFTVKRNKPVIENNFYDDFYFSSGTPIKQASYKVTVPKGLPLNIKVLNASAEPKVEERGNEVTYAWAMRDCDKIDDEEYMPSSEDVYKSISISSLKDWRQVGEWYWKLFNKNVKPSPEIKAKVKELTAGKATVADKVQAIIEYIRSNCRYVAMDMDSHNYEPHPAEEIYKNKYGDCKDQTLLAITMLAEAGVKAWPVLVSTDSEMKREDLLPMPNYFDHVILAFEIDNKQYYADVLYKGYRFQVTPSAYEGKRVFVLNEKGGYFTVLPSSDEDENTVRSNEDVTIKEDGTATVESKVTFSRSYSVRLREMLKQMSPDNKEKMFSSIETAVASGGKILDREWSNLDTPYALITGTIRYETTCYVQRMGDMMVFGMPQVSRSKIFTAPKRKFPVVVLSPNAVESSVSYTIPDGYEISVLPKNISLDSPHAAYLRQYEVRGTKIIGKELWKNQKCRVPVEKYSDIQNFLDGVVRSTNEKILIKKKS